MTVVKELKELSKFSRILATNEEEVDIESKVRTLLDKEYKVSLNFQKKTEHGRDFFAYNICCFLLTSSKGSSFKIESSVEG